MRLWLLLLLAGMLGSGCQQNPLVGNWVPAEPESNRLSLLSIRDDQTYEVNFKDTVIQPIWGYYEFKEGKFTFKNYHTVDNSVDESPGVYQVLMKSDSIEFVVLSDLVDLRKQDINAGWVRQ